MAGPSHGPDVAQTPGHPATGGPDLLERELRRMAVLQRRAIAQRRRTRRRPGPVPLQVRAL